MIDQEQKQNRTEIMMFSITKSERKALEEYSNEIGLTLSTATRVALLKMLKANGFLKSNIDKQMEENI